MPNYVLWNWSRDTLLAPSLRVARGLWHRLRNLLRPPRPGPGEAVLLLGCRTVPTYFAREPLDLVFLDSRGYVVATVPCAPPGQLVRGGSRASEVIAFAANSLRAGQVAVGDRLTLVCFPRRTE